MLNFFKGLAAFALFGILFLAFIAGVVLIFRYALSGQIGFALLILVILVGWGYGTMKSKKGEERNDWGV